MMTPAEHAEKGLQFRRAIGQARKMARVCLTRTEKRVAQQNVSRLESEYLQHDLNFHELTCYEGMVQAPNAKLTLSAAVNDILDAFRQANRLHWNRRLTEATIVGTSMRFCWQENGRLGVIVDGVPRDARDAEHRELMEAARLGHLEIYLRPLHGARSARPRIVLHQATGSR